MGEYWKETQRMLQGSPPLISKPKLTDALLQRPPFRFLFDIVSEVVIGSGWIGYGVDVVFTTMATVLASSRTI